LFLVYMQEAPSIDEVHATTIAIQNFIHFIYTYIFKQMIPTICSIYRGIFSETMTRVACTHNQ
jgi:hypothetical protein